MGRKAKFPIGAEVFGAFTATDLENKPVAVVESARVIGRDDKGRIILDRALNAFHGVEAVRRGQGFVTREAAINAEIAKLASEAVNLDVQLAGVRARIGAANDLLSKVG